MYLNCKDSIGDVVVNIDFFQITEVKILIGI